jgi:hypothetical protein
MEYRWQDPKTLKGSKTIVENTKETHRLVDDSWEDYAEEQD